mmetsp:Transcript_47875/g.120693  ORF Transcript_47875/g.120693 Transcript_47875/m.120693 type:complete len:200 (-) Transcript_47875:1182-1781(-)
MGLQPPPVTGSGSGLPSHLRGRHALWRPGRCCLHRPHRCPQHHKQRRHQPGQGFGRCQRAWLQVPPWLVPPVAAAAASAAPAGSGPGGRSCSRRIGGPPLAATDSAAPPRPGLRSGHHSAAVPWHQRRHRCLRRRRPPPRGAIGWRHRFRPVCHDGRARGRQGPWVWPTGTLQRIGGNISWICLTQRFCPVSHPTSLSM